MRQLKSTSKPRKRTLSIDVVVWRPADGKNSNCCASETLVVKAARLRLSERSKRRSFVPTSHEVDFRSEEHTSELQSLMRISYAVFCLKQTKTTMYHATKH